MKQTTIEIITERMALAHERHGEFRGAGHIIGTLRLELDETQYAANWQGRQRLIDELLDIAVVAIRGAEQLSCAETDADAAKPMMPDELWIPAINNTKNGTCFSPKGGDRFLLRQVNSNKGDIMWLMNADDARAIRDWLNQFIAASEAEQ